MKKNDLRDIIIVGAGPAGLSAAVTAAEAGIEVLVLDEQPAPGGQLYRNIERAGAETLDILGADYANGLSLVERFRRSGAEYLGGALVWNIEPDGSVYFSYGGRSAQVKGKFVIIAIGATERPVPFEGWNLPGVMGAGAVDANYKSSGTVPAGPVVVGGSGPLLLLVIGHLSSLGVEISAVLDTTPKGNMIAALPFLPRALRHSGYLLKGVGMLLNLKRSGIRYHKHVAGYQAHGKDRVESVSFIEQGKTHRIDSGYFLVHEGIVPRCDFSRLLKFQHHWDPVQRFWYPQVSRLGATENDKIYVAGDGAFVHGGIPAVLKGALAACDIAVKLKARIVSSTTDSLPGLEQKLAVELAPRPFVDRLYRPRGDLYQVSDAALVCRCEEVTVGEIRQAVREGCSEPNEIKALTRCGMGHCQGRMCGVALAEIVSAELKIEPDVLQPLNIRAPVRNLSLSELSEVDLLDAPRP